MIKKIVTTFCLIFSLAAIAQEGSSSPYSFYGIGDIKFKGTADNRAMGGLTMLSDSIHINFQNPASYSELKLTSLTVGASYLTTNQKTNYSQAKPRRTTMDYLAVGLPIGKAGIGFGLLPYSSVGYKIQDYNATTSETKKFSGTGGMNKVFTGIGYAITSKFSIGADINYNFGKISTSNIILLDIENGSKETLTSSLTGVNFNFGLNYKAKFGKKSMFTSMLTYTPESTLNLSNELSTATIRNTASGNEYVVDELDKTTTSRTIKLPATLAVGLGFGELKKWMIGGEITYKNSSVMSNRTETITKGVFEDAVKYTLGGYFIPNYNSYSSYFSKVVYRGGLRFENTGLIMNNKPIQDFAVTAGMGLPISGTFSNINIGLEIGKRGTKSAGLIEENYANISIGFSFNDKWFVRRLYN